MESIKFKQSTANPCIFVKNEESGVTIVAVYFDDLIIVSKTNDKMEETKNSLESKFKMKDLGKLHHCLGMTVEFNEAKKCLLLHQKYINTMLEKFGLTDCINTCKC